MGSSSGAAPTIFDNFQSPMNPETLTPNFGQISGVGSGQPPPGFGGFPMPNGFSEFFMPGMPTMLSSPYIPSAPQNQGAPAPSAPAPSMAAAPAANPGPQQQNPLMMDQATAAPIWGAANTGNPNGAGPINPFSMAMRAYG